MEIGRAFDFHFIQNFCAVHIRFATRELLFYQMRRKIPYRVAREVWTRLVQLHQFSSRQHIA